MDISNIKALRIAASPEPELCKYNGTLVVCKKVLDDKWAEFDASKAELEKLVGGHDKINWNIRWLLWSTFNVTLP